MNNTKKTVSINIRTSRAQKDLIDKAATMQNKTRSNFMLEAACQEAENVLLNQMLFQINKADYEAFEAALDRPISENSELQKILSLKAPWEH